MNSVRSVIGHRSNSDELSQVVHDLSRLESPSKQPEDPLVLLGSHNTSCRNQDQLTYDINHTPMTSNPYLPKSVNVGNTPNSTSDWSTKIRSNAEPISNHMKVPVKLPPTYGQTLLGITNSSCLPTKTSTTERNVSVQCSPSDSTLSEVNKTYPYVTYTQNKTRISNQTNEIGAHSGRLTPHVQDIGTPTSCSAGVNTCTNIPGALSLDTQMLRQDYYSQGQAHCSPFNSVVARGTSNATPSIIDASSALLFAAMHFTSNNTQTPKLPEKSVTPHTQRTILSGTNTNEFSQFNVQARQVAFLPSGPEQTCTPKAPMPNVPDIEVD